MRIIWFSYLEEQSNSGIRFRRKLTKGFKRVRVPLFTPILSKKKLEQWDNTKNKWDLFNPALDHEIDQHEDLDNIDVFSLNYDIDDEEILKEKLGLGNDYYIEEEEVTVKPINFKLFNALKKLNSQFQRYGNDLILRKSKDAQADEFRNAAKKNIEIKIDTSQVTFEEDKDEEEEEEDEEEDAEMKDIAANDEEEEEEEEEDESPKEDVPTQDQNNIEDMEIEHTSSSQQETQLYGENEEKRVKTINISEDPKLYDPSKIISINKELKTLEESDEIDPKALEYRKNLQEKAKQYGLTKGFDLNGLPRFDHCLSFILLAVHLIGEVLLPSDLIRWIENTKFPYFEFGIIFKQFNAYQNHFVLTVCYSNFFYVRIFTIFIFDI